MLIGFIIVDTVWLTLPVAQLVLRVKDELELDDEDLMNGDELDVWPGDTFSNIELSKPSNDDISFDGNVADAPDIPFWMLFKHTGMGEVHMSLAMVLEDEFLIDPLFIEFVREGNKVDADIVTCSGDLTDFAFINSAASALEMFSCFFHFVRRFWNHILT